ncbi:single-stranded-DNA-specific exonuclease RecJ [Calothrix sp. 336/3]|uniref:single-stranded-DNA-specific exonuclease RecJ n=1 Tax=Calothrix sp. 336/3 TaxID=1337936 RepID=UPI0004E3BA03|nr:single-stranded-DNA-specific exonuclease RecJ [Calothrix sp. 336/3]AKG20322.1 single-stranded DNA exonuclease [Calothrix sp. 336/3]
MEWILASTEQPPESFIAAVKEYTRGSSGNYAAQILWQRGIREPEQLTNFINSQVYKPANPGDFGQEMQLAVVRLQQARESGEKVAIWGDFDADGITSTAVLWDGLGQFFVQHLQLSYYIPNRFTESHGLNCAGIDRLAEQGCKLIVTCDTGSTNISEILYAQKLGIDVIVTDHHTLPPERPPAIAIINPRYLPNHHPLYHLSGVAVAYKLVEGLYQYLPDVPRQPLEDLLDLVAVGLIADLVQLSGDCRYLAQVGIQRLQSDYLQPPTLRRRPGLGRLLELCQRSGDRPTDISFGLGPRINAVSRIQGDASFCVELLTSRDQNHVKQLAESAELANTRRKSLQKDVAQQVSNKLKQMDLSTTSVIVLEDSQWAVGVLGLVAGQVAQETGKPTILLSTEPGETANPLARGSARSVSDIDLYQLVQGQAHLLHRFGGHPFAAGLSLPVENIPLFTEAINQQLRQSLGGKNLIPKVTADLLVTVADLGKELFNELKLLEPCGMGNPVPKLLLRNCRFTNAWHRNQEDLRGKKVQYIKTDFDLGDDSTNSTFPGVWWGHYKDELPPGRCDCIVELDYNSFKKRYEVRLIDVAPGADNPLTTVNLAQNLWDFRLNPLGEDLPQPEQSLLLEECPTSWEDLRAWLRRSQQEQKTLVLAWQTPGITAPEGIWRTLVGIAKYLSRTQQPVTRTQLLAKLNISNQSLIIGLKALRHLGFSFQRQDRLLFIHYQASSISPTAEAAITEFLTAIREEQFQREYFTQVPLKTIAAILK